MQAMKVNNLGFYYLTLDKLGGGEMIGEQQGALPSQVGTGMSAPIIWQLGMPASLFGLTGLGEYELLCARFG